MIHEINNANDFKKKLAEAGDQLVIVDFFATWCGPCKLIAPKVLALSVERTDIVFIKVDVDEAEDLAMEYEIASMPTFVFIKKEKKLDSFAGANIDKLMEKVELHK